MSDKEFREKIFQLINKWNTARYNQVWCVIDVLLDEIRDLIIDRCLGSGTDDI